MSASEEPFYEYFDGKRRSSHFADEKDRSVSDANVTIRHVRSSPFCQESPPVMVHVIQIPNSKKDRSVSRLHMSNLKANGDLPWILVVVQSVLIICLLFFFFGVIMTRDNLKSTAATRNVSLSLPSSISPTPRPTTVATLPTTSGRTFTTSPATASTSTDAPTTPTSESPLSTSTEHIPVGKFQRSAIVSNDQTCSDIGRSVLIRGGNAVDAMIATVVCVNAANFGDAFGGGFIATMFNSTTHKCAAIDALPTAPTTVSESLLQQENAPDVRFIATPGALNGLYRMYERYGSGKVFWSELITPTVDLCRRGFPVPREVARVIQKNYHKLKGNKQLHSEYINPETLKLYKEGDIIRRYTYAESLEALAEAEDPVDLFYRGEMGEIIVKEFRNDSFLALNDLEDYETIFYEDNEVMSNAFSFHNMRLCGPPPPSSYAISQAVVAAVTELQQYSTSEDIRLYHNLVEAARKIELQRPLLGDLDYSSLVKEIATNMSTPDFAKHIANAVRSWPRTLDDGQFERVQAQKSSDGSLSVTIVDSKGNAIAASTTSTDLFTSETISKSLGFVWNTQLRAFDYKESSNVANNNKIRAGKRPVSSLAPLLVVDTASQKMKMALSGLDDSAMIASFLLRLLFFKQSSMEAITAPQTSLGFANADIIHDGRLAKNTVDYLTSIGHRIGIARRRDFFAIIRENDNSLTATAGTSSYPLGY
uniref:Gamma-glutamyltranspeptidase 1 n=1 Tax=Steinernema glaseri TaxID=37863 RepID=A0A1I7Y121_9BILA